MRKILFFIFLAIAQCLFSQQNDCLIDGLSVETGDCNPDGTYALSVNFALLNAPNATHFNVWANNNSTLLGSFPLSQLPLTIPAFPTNGGANDVIKICIAGVDDCCKIKEFPVPNCNPVEPCSIQNLQAMVGDCNDDSTYQLTVNFTATNPGNSGFDLWANGSYFGFFQLSQLPLSIAHFPTNGGANDFIKVCINDQPNCCAVKEFPVPNCNPVEPCSIQNLQVVVGDCNDDSTYQLTVNFTATNPGNSGFDLWANGSYFGFFQLSQLPLSIAHFPTNGGANDFIKVCINDQPNCCAVKEFPVPNCNPVEPCSIQNLQVMVGDCNDDSTYQLTVNFTATNPGNSGFDLWANGSYFGFFQLSQLPLSIAHFPTNGGANDFIKVCINDQPNCCAVKEFPVPNCNPVEPCSIQNLQVVVGDCNDDSTYQLTVNFTATNPGNSGFDLWANGSYFGFFQLSQLPLSIAHFPTNGGANDFIKVCINDQPNCCAVKEFPVPNCNPVEPCSIQNLQVMVGDCNDDSTYQLTVNFTATNPGNSGFDLWANGSYFGFFQLSQLPLSIAHFPTNGGANDFIKVCINDQPNCCAVKEFPVPNCNPVEPCSIQNLQVMVGDCNDDSTYQLTVNFTATNPGNSGFDLWANGSYFGFFQLSQLPLSIAHFPTNGGANDFIKVCINDQPNCCAVKEFPVPNCNPVEPCSIQNLQVVVGDCNDDSTYQLTVNFTATNPGNSGFDLWANGAYFGFFQLSQLPLSIAHFPTNGGANDFIKVCINDQPDCCAVKEFPVPNCNPVDPCLADGLSVEIGDCNPDGTYQLAVSFDPLQPIAPETKLYIYTNNILTDSVQFEEFPIVIADFLPTNGADEDTLMICYTPVIDYSCCAYIKWISPNCFSGGGDDGLQLVPNPLGDDGVLHGKVLGSAANAGEGTVFIFDALGNEVKTEIVPMSNNFEIDLNFLPSGWYSVQLITPNFTKSAIFIKEQ